VSCVGRFTLDERVDLGFPVRSKQALVLIWSFHDPIHPQLILEAPEDINCFRFNPSVPDLIAGGCINGQIFLWDISEHQERLKSTRKAKSDGPAGGAGDGAGGGSEKSESNIPIVKPVVASSIDFSHRGSISDLQWLPSNYLVRVNIIKKFN
jgi:hypothetical protein